MMDRLINQVREVLLQCNAADMLGMALVIFCVSFYLSVIVPARHQLEAVTKLIGHASEVRPIKVSMILTRRDPSAQLAEFYRFFPSLADLPQILRRINRAAIKQSFAFDQGDYQPTPDPDGRLVHYQMTLPLEGDYPHMRSFLTQALAENPTLALDSLELKRSRVGDPLVNVDVHFTLYVRGDG